MGKDVFLDIEANGLLDTVTKLHSLVVRDVDTDEVLASCVGGTDAECGLYDPLSFGLEFLEKAERIYAHNLIRYDMPVLDKLTGFKIPWGKVRDTQVIAGLRFTNLKELDVSLVQKGRLPPALRGKHKLEAWGHRLGVLKDHFKVEEENQEERWENWTPELQSYCEQDTAVGTALVRHIRRAGATPLLAIETEQELCEYLDKQEQNGWPFNIDAAVELQAKLAAQREELSQELKTVFGRWFKPVTKHGEVEVFTAKRANKKLCIEKGSQYTKIKLIEFNPGSRQQIGERLQKLYGWKPLKFTAGGQPEINEETLEQLPQHLPGVKLLSEYLMVGKRLGQLAEGDQAWLKYATKDRPTGGKKTGMHHIHGVCLQSGTITHRAAHCWPNLGQVPAIYVPFGVECRSLFTVPPGWIQIGADASGLELRGLSHYMARFDGGAYGKTVTEGRNDLGTDIHSVNRNALGLEGKEGRDQAKRFIYAFLYGAGDLKLGLTLGCKPEEVEQYKLNTKHWKRTKGQLEGRNKPTDDYTVACAMKGGQLRKRFLKNLPALSNLIESVKVAAKERGYLVLNDGRRVPVRHFHAALNSLLQGSGAVVCKRWIVRANRRLTAEFGPQGWDGLWAALGWIHDELQLAVRPQIKERVKQILVEEIREVGKEFNLRVPLDGEAKEGTHWAACH